MENTKGELLKLQEKSKSEESNQYKENSSKEVEEVKYNEVKGTSFYIAKCSTEEGYRITIGNTLASKKSFETEKQAREYIRKKPWELLENMALLMAKDIYNIMRGQ